MRLIHAKHSPSREPSGRLRRAFTIVEVVASVAVLGIMLSGVVLAFRRTVENVVDRALDEQAAAVAQRRMEQLIATRQEPETEDMQGRDEMFPEFLWELRLRRVAASDGPARGDLSNTVIEAVVSVSYEGEYSRSEPIMELARYFQAMIPIEGQAVAVPLTYDKEDPLWYLELHEKLGREPSAEETIREMARLGMLSEDLAEMFGSEAD